MLFIQKTNKDKGLNYPVFGILIASINHLN